MKKTIAAIAGVLLLPFAAATASADGYLTPGEESLGDAISGSMCEYIENNGVTMRSMTNLFDIVYRQPEVADGGDVADVINYAVYTYCPDHWDELVSFGEGVRGMS